jgi:hypothetical protein
MLEALSIASNRPQGRPRASRGRSASGRPFKAEDSVEPGGLVQPAVLLDCAEDMLNDPRAVDPDSADAHRPDARRQP